MKKVKLTAKRITYWMKADCETEVLMNEGDTLYLEDVTRVCPIKGFPFLL